jgi:hypothetical protein
MQRSRNNRSPMSVADSRSIGDDLITRWPAARRFLIIGSVSTIAGGVVAAVARPTGFELGPWLAAYLVLVGGVAQIALGVGQAWLAEERTAVRAEVASWNSGVGATIVGTLVSTPIVTTFGGVASVVALSLFLGGVRNTRSPSVRVSVAREGRVWLRSPCAWSLIGNVRPTFRGALAAD